MTQDPPSIYTWRMIKPCFKYLIQLTAPLLVIAAGSLVPGLVKAESSELSIDRIPVCMNFSCKDTQLVGLDQEEWDSIANWLRPAAEDAGTERLNIVKAIGWFEAVVGQHTPTHRDLGGDLGDPAATFPGQLDCIDESLNTTTYLKLFEQEGLLKHHRVVERAYRRAITDQHWAGQIETLDGKERWVIDSWFQNNGYLPYLQSTAEWNDINILYSANVDSSQPKPKKEGNFFTRLFD